MGWSGLLPILSPSDVTIHVMKKKTILCLAVGCVLAAGGIFCLLFQVAGGQVLPRRADALDLREREITCEQYREIRAALPDCDITWSVPFQGGLVSSDVEELNLETLAPEDTALLPFFTRLKTLQVQAPADYPGLLEFARANSDCTVTYGVSLGEQQWDSTQKAITVADASLEELQQLLAVLPDVEEISLTGTLPHPQVLLAVTEAAPRVAFHWTLTLGDMVIPENTKELVYTGAPCPMADIVTILKSLPRLEYGDLRQCGFSDKTMFALCREFPEVFFLWEVPIGQSRFLSDVTELDVSGIPFETAQQIEDLLPCFPNVERVIMCGCGLDNETMDALNREYEDIRFVWTVRIGYFNIRTDATYFYPFKLDKHWFLNNEEASLLRYCTDMVCIDVGHHGAITDCQWAAYMPHLRYLIIGETGISDLSPLANCKELEYLEMFTIPVTDYSPLVECTALEDLNLGKTYADPTPIAKMTWLKNLWWCGAPTRNLPSSPAMEILPEALPNTTIKLWLEHPTASGWRKLDNYFAMRDYMGMFYLT